MANKDKQRGELPQLRILHEADLCIGCGHCAAVAPEHFEMAGNGLSELKAAAGPPDRRVAAARPEDRKAVEEAVEGCPVDIIHLVEESDEQ